jgi:hypothetical protein
MVPRTIFRTYDIAYLEKFPTAEADGYILMIRSNFDFLGLDEMELLSLSG